MTLAAKHFALLAFLLSCSGGAEMFCPDPASVSNSRLTLALIARTDHIRSSGHVPSDPRPVLLDLKEAGIDEEDSDELDTPMDSGLPRGDFPRSRLNVCSRALFANPVQRGPCIASFILRC